MKVRNSNSERCAVAAISLIAMCLVTFDHEALGHGGTCLAIGGHIVVLTSSIFHCDLRSIWIDPAGPISNIFVGAIALMMKNRVPRRLANTRLLLLLVTSFSFFWEAAYLFDAMGTRNGDLYFAGRDFLGEPTLWWRIAGAAAGIALYRFTARWASAALSNLWPDAASARGVARTAWVSASVGAALAALVYSGEGWGDFRDAVLEIGVASFPLLFIPRQSVAAPTTIGPAHIRRPGITIALSIIVYATFVATLGRGLHY
jgi:hypothetical protein